MYVLCWTTNSLPPYMSLCRCEIPVLIVHFELVSDLGERKDSYAVQSLRRLRFQFMKKKEILPFSTVHCGLVILRNGFLWFSCFCPVCTNLCANTPLLRHGFVDGRWVWMSLLVLRRTRPNKDAILSCYRHIDSIINIIYS